MPNLGNVMIPLSSFTSLYRIKELSRTIINCLIIFLINKIKNWRNKCGLILQFYLFINNRVDDNTIVEGGGCANFYKLSIYRLFL